MVEGQHRLESAARAHLDSSFARLEHDVGVVPVELRGGAAQRRPVNLTRRLTVGPPLKDRVPV